MMSDWRNWIVARPIAHRGLHGLTRDMVENSHSAAAAALAHDYHIECDVQVSADGEAFYHLQSAFCRKSHAETFTVLSHIELDAQQHAQEP